MLECSYQNDSSSRARTSWRRYSAIVAGLLLLRSRAIPGHCGLHERLERARIDRLAFVNVDCPSRIAFQAGIEEVRWSAIVAPCANDSFTTFV